MTEAGWANLVAGLEAAGKHLDESTRDLDPAERTDGQRALLRAVNNLLGRFEIAGDTPELTPFNGWRQKFFMDNPDYRYWITDIGDGTGYRITGNVGSSVYQSITAYAGRGIADATAVARIDSDDLVVDADGTFVVTLTRRATERPSDVEIPEGTSSVWVRFVHDEPAPVDPGTCRIERLDPARPATAPDDAKFARDLSRLGAFISQVPRAFEMSAAEDLAQTNSVRHWSAMTGGAAFTEPGIHYLRGSWSLAQDECLVIDGPLVSCRHWNIVLYSRFLNSLDYRNRTVSRTTANATVADGRFRFALAGQNPGIDGHDWLDTEGRAFGIFVMRFLQPESEPELPDVRVVPHA
ncbi:DUF1214 domain-containing protein [Mycobacterium neglectum]|uniref:DUF1214 domain-containing protein n=1 Tax=Mycobacterium neglectum TaxID=242737 RepID=UPI000BFEC486|nr:DUF1214 domain-containing protein [Mycobacterium neglectum]